MNETKEKYSMSRTWLAAATAGVLALGVSACGSSSDNSSSTSASGGTSSGSSGTATPNGSGSTFAPPVPQQLGRELKGRVLTINYRAVGPGRGVSALTKKSTLSAGSDPPMADDEIAAAKKNGDPVHVPTAFGAITVS